MQAYLESCADGFGADDSSGLGSSKGASNHTHAIRQAAMTAHAIGEGQSSGSASQGSTGTPEPKGCPQVGLIVVRAGKIRRSPKV